MLNYDHWITEVVLYRRTSKQTAEDLHGTTFALQKPEARAVLAQKFWGHCPISPFITESIFSVFRNRKKYELHMGLYLQSIISRVAKSVMV